MSTDTKIRWWNRPKKQCPKSACSIKSIGCSGDVKERHGIDADVWSNAKTEELSFTRTLHDPSIQTPLKASHLFLRDGDAMRLVSIIEGGQNSTTVLDSEGKSWLLFGERSVREVGRESKVLKRFSSQALYSVLLNFSNDIETNGPWRSLNSVDKTGVGWVLIESLKIMILVFSRQSSIRTLGIYAPFV